MEELEHIIEKQLERDAARRNRRFRKYLTSDEEEDASDLGSVKSGLTNATNNTFQVSFWAIYKERQSKIAKTSRGAYCSFPINMYLLPSFGQRP